MFEDFAAFVNQKFEDVKAKESSGHATIYDFIMVPEGDKWKVYRKPPGQERTLVFESDDTESVIKYLWQNTPH